MKVQLLERWQCYQEGAIVDLPEELAQWLMGTRRASPGLGFIPQPDCTAIEPDSRKAVIRRKPRKRKTAANV